MIRSVLFVHGPGLSIISPPLGLNSEVAPGTKHLRHRGYRNRRVQGSFGTWSAAAVGGPAAHPRQFICALHPVRNGYIWTCCTVVRRWLVCLKRSINNSAKRPEAAQGLLFKAGLCFHKPPPIPGPLLFQASLKLPLCALGEISLVAPKLLNTLAAVGQSLSKRGPSLSKLGRTLARRSLHLDEHRRLALHALQQS